jgi:hypothetical protein
MYAGFTWWSLYILQTAFVTVKKQLADFEIVIS